MKRFWVLAWMDYYPDPALGNVDSWYDTYNEAHARVTALQISEDDFNDWAVIVDMDKWSPGSKLDLYKIQLRY